MKSKYVLIIVLTLMLTRSSSAQLDVNSAKFSSRIADDEEYSWRIENYQIGDTKVQSRTSPDSFEFIDDSTIELQILKDPSAINLANRKLSDGGGLEDYFELRYDSLTYDFKSAAQLYIWVFPTDGVDASGNNIDLTSEFWIYNLYNLLNYGSTLEFNDTLPDGDVTTEDNGEAVTLTFSNGDSSLQAEVDKTTGLMDSINFVSDSPDFRIEINRKGGSSFLPISPWFSLLPLILLPILLRKIRN